MDKQNYYFPHDSNAHTDPKCSALISEHGMSAYGIYWCLIEIMHEQGGKIKKFPKLSLGLAHQLNTDPKQIEAVLQVLLNDYELLVEDPTHIWSDRVLRNIEHQITKRQKKVDAGRVGGIQSGIKRSKTKQCFKQTKQTKQSKVKESKVKIESKPPTVEEISLYVKTKGYSVKPQEFFNYYDVAGWVDKNGKKVRNWKQKLITWDSYKDEKGEKEWKAP